MIIMKTLGYIHLEQYKQSDQCESQFVAVNSEYTFIGKVNDKLNVILIKRSK